MSAGDRDRIMTQTAISGDYYNANLFSNYYLDERIYGLDEWDCDGAAREAMEELQDLYERERDQFAGRKEDQHISRWIEPVLETLGFAHASEATLPNGGGYVDRTLFGSDDELLAAENGDSETFFARSLALLEAKQWGHDFEAEFGTDRQYRNASHQIKHYLEQTPDEVGWGVLTDGKKWRLYGTKEYEARTYYEVDLPELLERGNLEAFKRFFVFFRAEAFRAVGETTFLDRVWAESETAAQELGEDLQDNVFTALRVLGEGFVESNDLDIDPGDEEALAELKEQSLVLLYRLMFVSYAESRDLIHPEGEERAEYEENFSFGHLRETVKETVDSGETFASGFSTYSDSMWSRLSRLFDLVDSGEEALGIPAYNGGLFDPMKHAFLDEHSVYDRWLAEVVYLISTTDSETSDEVVFADYADLDTRHLGSIYEGLLEHEFRIAGEPLAAVADDGGQTWKPADEVTVADAVETVEPGELYVVNDDGERKATGAYYTPDYVVTYIVEETIDPLLDEIRADLNADGLESGDPQFYARFHRRVLDLTVLDPAMGSGHFLTKATEYLAEAVMEESRELASAGGIDEQAVRREISKECIYGVDLNGMAVELAKLSMWLETLATDQPLAFLDHHLKSGNSLVGSDIETIEGLESDASDDADTQSSLAEFGATRAGTIERLMDIYQEFLAIENEDIEDAREMERKYREIEQDDLRQRLVGMANVATAEDFGVDVPSGAYERMARSLEADDEWADVEQQDWYQTGQSLADDHDFFHWKLEFPEVFYDRDGGMAEQSGYDAVVGNPPYVFIDSIPEELRGYYAESFNTWDYRYDIYGLFIELAINTISNQSQLGYIVPHNLLNNSSFSALRQKIVAESTNIRLIDFTASVFEDASNEPMLVLFEHTDIPDQTPTLQSALISPDTLADSTVPFSKYDATAIESLPENPFIVRGGEWVGKVLRHNKATTLGNHVDAVQGLRTGNNTERLSNKKETENHRKALAGEDIHRYGYQWNNTYVLYDRELLSKDTAARPREKKYWEADEKIVVQEIRNVHLSERIVAAIDREGYISLNTTNAIISKPESHYSLSYVMSILNSRLMNELFKCCFVDNHIATQYLESLPMYTPAISQTEALSEKEKEKLINRMHTERIEAVFSDTDYPYDRVAYDILSKLSERVTNTQAERDGINTHLPDYLGSYDDGSTLKDLSPMPPSGLADSVLTKGMGDVEQYETVRATEATVERTGNRVTVSLVPYVKPIESERDEYETNTHGYTSLDPVPAMEFHDVDDDLAALLEAFVPYAVEEEAAGYRDGTTKTISLLDRLEGLTLPAIEDVRDGIERYEQATERAAELEAQIERTDDLIDELVYDLYGLTDEEIEIVEQAVGE
jgi:type I restriction-modification system DNA methylase subunit